MSKSIFTALTLAALLTIGLATATAVPVQPADPVSYYLFDDGTANDSGIGGNNGTLTGNATVTNADSAFGAGSVALDGVGDYVNLGTGLSGDFEPQADAFSISVWVKFDPDGAPAPGGLWGMLVDKGGQYRLWNHADEGPMITLGNTHNAISDADSAIENGAWHNMVMTAPAATSGPKIYLDGVLTPFAGTFSSGNIGNVLAASTPTLLGSRNGATNYDVQGWMDEVAFFNYELSADEAEWLSQNSLVPEPATMALLAIGGLGMLARRRRR